MTIKLKCYEEKEKDDTVRLILRNGGLDNVYLQAVDVNGIDRPGGQILSIGAGGCIQRYPNINSDFGFDLNDKGQIRVKGIKEDNLTMCGKCAHDKIKAYDQPCSMCIYNPSHSNKWEARDE